MIPLIFICVIFFIVDATAFSTMSKRMRSSPALGPLCSSVSSKGVSADVIVDEIDDDVTCYVTNDEEVITEGEKPHVVCTSEPEE